MWPGALIWMFYRRRPGPRRRVVQRGPAESIAYAVESRLAPFRTLKMSTKEMVENFPPPQVLKAIENGRMSMPHDPAKKAVYESRMAAYQQRQQNKEDKGAAGANTGLNNMDQPADTKSVAGKPAAAGSPAAGTKDTPAEMHLDPNDPPM